MSASPYIELTSFSLIVLVYWVLSELFATLFRFTGLSDEKARFQLISLLTGCGFTTQENELLLTNRSRRRLARITMLFGYVFNITIISLLINAASSIIKTFDISKPTDLFSILIPILAAAVIITFMRVKKLRAWGDRQIERLADRLTRNKTGNTVLLIDYLGEDSIAQVTLVNVPETLRDKPLSKSGLKPEHNILVMLTERSGKKAEPASAQTVFLPSDKLTVFGDYHTVCRVFEAGERFEEQD